MTGPHEGSAPSSPPPEITHRLLDTAIVEAERSHHRTDATETSPGSVPSSRPADQAPGKADGRQAGTSSADAGGGPDLSAVPSPDPLGAVPQPADAEGEGAHSGSAIRGNSPCATSYRSRNVSHPNELRDLADRARTAVTQGWGPRHSSKAWHRYVGWHRHLDGTRGLVVASYLTAVDPAAVIALLDERDRYHDALAVIADNPCSAPAGPMACEELSDPDGDEWCSYCRARAALNQTTAVQR